MFDTTVILISVIAKFNHFSFFSVFFSFSFSFSCFYINRTRILYLICLSPSLSLVANRIFIRHPTFGVYQPSPIPVNPSYSQLHSQITFVTLFASLNFFFIFSYIASIALTLSQIIKCLFLLFVIAIIVISNYSTYPPQCSIVILVAFTFFTSL